MNSSLWLWGILTAAVALSISYAAYRMYVRMEALKRENRKLAAEALGAVQMKKDFVSRVSHELKAPLASMQETTHLLLERIPGPLTEKQHRLLDLNMQSGKRLAAMIGNLLDLSRLEAGIADFDMVEHDLRETLQNVVTERGREAGEKALRVVTALDSQPLIVRGDPPRLGQLFSNLLENAINFSPKEGTIRITGALQKDRILISIADNGPGVSDAEKRKVFEAFHSTAARRNKLRGQGFGLGLAIAEAIATAHGGVISLRDNPEGGSVFSVLLPGPKSGLAADRLDDLHLDIA